MSNSEPVLPIDDILTLLNQEDIRYGTFEGTATADDFKCKLIEDFNDREIYENMLKWGTIWQQKNFTLEDKPGPAVVGDYVLLHSMIANNCDKGTMG